MVPQEQGYCAGGLPQGAWKAHHELSSSFPFASWFATKVQWGEELTAGGAAGGLAVVEVPQGEEGSEV